MFTPVALLPDKDFSALETKFYTDNTLQEHQAVLTFAMVSHDSDESSKMGTHENFLI